MHRDQFFSRVNLSIFAATLGLVAASWVAAPSAYAEPKPDEAAHEQLCADLFLIYDTNMDIYYDRSNSDAVRQQAYKAAHEALSDYRRQGCKGGTVSRLQEVMPSVNPTINVQGTASGGAATGRNGVPTTASRQLIQSE
jgi:hypothetical protein